MSKHPGGDGEWGIARGTWAVGRSGGTLELGIERGLDRVFDGNFRKAVDRRTKPVGKALVRMGVTADRLTILGVVLSFACAAAIGTGHLLLGFALLVAAALPDLLDGPVAKASGTQSIRGEFFDSVSDRVTDSVVLGGVAWYLADTRGGLAPLLPMALLGASQLISYERAKAEIHGFDAKGGLMERAERVIALCVGLVFSVILVPVLWVMLVLTVVTGVQRFAKVWKQATDENPVLAARRRETPPFVRNLFVAWSEADERRRRRWRERADEQRQQRRRARSERNR
jgi:CDP-diacylglycerol---glycerol-3-phosphate 3-phosphatidyltransferase